MALEPQEPFPFCDDTIIAAAVSEFLTFPARLCKHALLPDAVRPALKPFEKIHFLSLSLSVRRERYILILPVFVFFAIRFCKLLIQAVCLESIPKRAAKAPAGAFVGPVCMRICAACG